MPTIGDTLAGRYRIDAPLGAGGMATVYRAHDLRLDRDVAIKVLLPNLAADRVLAARFDREARALAAISHPNIVAIFDVEPADEATGREPFFVMELVDGGSLADRLDDAGGRLSPDEVVPILVAIADGLAAIHGAGLLHRDVKPHNVLLAADRPRLADLGLARPGDATGLESLTASGTALGTLPYLAPERLAGNPASEASDVWSLGASAYIALTGRLPRPSMSIADIADRRTEPPPSVSSVAPDLGTAFDASLAATLDPNPAGRPSALAVGASLATALGRWSRSVRGVPVGAARGGREGGRRIGVRGAPPPVVAPLAASLSAPPPVGGPPTEATTVAVQLPRQEAAASRGRQSATRNSLTGPIIFGVAALIGLIVVAAGLNWLGSSGQATVPSPSTPLVLISPSTSLSPSPSPSPSPSQSPSPTQATTPPPDRFAAARDRLTETYQAIEAAKGGGGLKGKEANQLRGPADKVGRAIDANDARGARAAADDLIDAVRKDIDEKRVGGEDAQRLLSAAQALRDSIPAG